ncbi:unnamed protein product, partial [Diamesa tonsa]
MRQFTRLLCSIQQKSFKSGDFIKETRTITQKDLDVFSELTGDYNPIHKTSNNSEAIVHGAYLNGIVAGIIGTKFPGPGSIVVEQNFSFPNKCLCEKPINFHIELTEARKILKVTYDIAVNLSYAQLNLKNELKQKFASLSKIDMIPAVELSNNSIDTTASSYPCSCAVFLSGQFKKGSGEQPKGLPALMMHEIEGSFSCNSVGNKMCINKCLDSIVKHLPNSASIICGTIDRDCYKERAYLFIQNCSPNWINSNLSAGREYCCKSGEPYKCG